MFRKEESRGILMCLMVLKINTDYCVLRRMRKTRTMHSDLYTLLNFLDLEKIFFSVVLHVEGTVHFYFVFFYFCT